MGTNAAQGGNADNGRWKRFALLSALMLAGGAVSIFLPSVAAFASSIVLGAVLAVVGLFKIIQSLRMRECKGFAWQEATGIVELIGGILLLVSPFKGALAVALLIAIVLLIHGAAQIGLSFRLRATPGRYWIAISGLVAIAAGIAIIVKLPLITGYEPGAIAGIALLVAGLSYALVAFTARKATL